MLHPNHKEIQAQCETFLDMSESGCQCTILSTVCNKHELSSEHRIVENSFV